MRDNLKVNDDDIYSAPVNEGVRYDNSKPKVKPKGSWLDGASKPAPKDGEPVELPRSQGEQQEIDEAAAAEGLGEVDDLSNFDDLDEHIPGVEGSHSSDGEQGDEELDDVNGDEDDGEDAMVPRTDYEMLERRIELLTHDFEVLKGRQEAARVEDRQNANMNLAKVLLPIFDDLDTAIHYSEENGLDTMELEGVVKIRRKLSNALGAEGLRVIDPAGEPFDMNEHQAIERDDGSDLPADVVTRVYQVGYKMNGRLIRPALVAVSC